MLHKVCLFLFLLALGVVPTLAQDEDQGDDSATFTIIFDEMNALAETRGFHFAGYKKEDVFYACFVEDSVTSANEESCDDAHWSILDYQEEPHGYVVSVEIYWQMMDFLRTSPHEGTNLYPSPVRSAFSDVDCSEPSQYCLHTVPILPREGDGFCLGRVIHEMGFELNSTEGQFDSHRRTFFSSEIGGRPAALIGDYVVMYPIRKFGFVYISIKKDNTASAPNSNIAWDGVADVNDLEVLHCPLDVQIRG